MNASHEGAKEGWETKRPALHEREYGLAFLLDFSVSTGSSEFRNRPLQNCRDHSQRMNHYFRPEKKPRR